MHVKKRKKSEKNKSPCRNVQSIGRYNKAPIREKCEEKTPIDDPP